jgi:RES domain-containing protein
MTNRLKQLTLWRLDRQKYVDNDTCCSGTGASLFPGRWNKKNEPVLYTAVNLSLAFLEIYVHLSFDKLSPQAARENLSRRVIQIYLDDLEFEEVTVERLNALNSSWRQHRSPKLPANKCTFLQELGSDWFTGRATPVLKVPSAIVPHESNYLINPTHPDIADRLLLKNPVSNIGKVGQVSTNALPKPFEFDARYVLRAIQSKS